MSSVTQTPGTTLRLKYRDSAGTDQDIPYPIGTQSIFRPHPTRFSKGLPQYLFVDDFRNPVLGFYNDAKGQAFRDTRVPFMGHPTMCVEAVGFAATLGSDPGAGGPNVGGCITKRRIGQRYSSSPVLGGKWGFEWWMYFSGGNLTSNSQTTMSMYVRDGTNWYGGRIWFEAASIGTAPLSIRVLQSTGAWVEEGTYNFQRGVTYAPSTAGDLGEWHYCKLRIDLGNLKYIDFQFNDLLIDLSTRSLRTNPDASGGRSLHFSFEEASGSATAIGRFYHVGYAAATIES